jgi:RNA polymerase sigma-70 factor (ECF subfamily)
MRDNENKITDYDHELISLCKKGDMEAFETLVRKHQNRMLNIAYRMIGNYEEACEIVQDAFVSAYRGMKNFQEKSKFHTWLYAIVINITKNRLKQIQARLYHEPFSLDEPILTDEGNIKVEPASNEPSILEKLEKKDIQHKVQGCINSLENEFREVLVLRDIQGFSYDEIGDILKIAGGTVKSRLFRARDSIKNCLKRVLGEL